MSFPPPPPSNQPPQPPHGNPGGYGPPAGGYGPGGQGQGGYGPGGYGPPAGGNQPAGGFGPPAGGYGAPGPGGPGGWQQPPVPPGGGGNGKIIAAIIGGGAVVLAAVITFIVINNSDDGGSNNRAQSPGSSAGATPSESASPTPSYEPTPTATPTDSDFESSLPTPGAGKIPFYLMKPGDCYDRPAGGGGNNDKASCSGPHDAEVVTTHRLASGLTTETDIRSKASSLCRNELERKAARQPAGTAEGTYVQYPTLQGYKIGIKTISCSLAGNSTGTKKLTRPLS
ncbi:hypothetical protein [Streptomyces caniferus]|uniref:hypothetical protein n=1 Tax=Streptomyces caniferus TaxID=285557 RepID=UPI00381DEE85